MGVLRNLKQIVRSHNNYYTLINDIESLKFRTRLRVFSLIVESILPINSLLASFFLPSDRIKIKIASLLTTLVNILFSNEKMYQLVLMDLFKLKNSFKYKRMILFMIADVYLMIGIFDTNTIHV